MANGKKAKTPAKSVEYKEMMTAIKKYKDAEVKKATTSGKKFSTKGMTKEEITALINTLSKQLTLMLKAEKKVANAESADTSAK